VAISMTNLYLMVFQEKKVFKIGKADDIENRMDQLRKYWGSPDFNSSYSVEISTDSVFKLEKALHLMLSDYSEHIGTGDGQTEFFSISALVLVLDYIKLYLSHSVGILKKGVVLRPVAANGKKLKPVKKYGPMEPEKKRRAIKRVSEIEQLLYRLYKNKDDLIISCEIIENIIKFRVETVAVNNIHDFVRTHRSFHKNDLEFGIYGSRSILSCVRWCIHNGEFSYAPEDGPIFDATPSYRYVILKLNRFNIESLYISNQIEIIFRQFMEKF